MNHEKLTKKIFFEMLKAGLWNKEVQLLPFAPINFSAILKIAEEQSVVGLIAAGLENVKDIKVAKQDIFKIIGISLQIEQQNTSMNLFISKIAVKLSNENINIVLVKGQGIAQCYLRPLWRTCGDVDLLLDSRNYEKAKHFFAKIASSIEQEEFVSKHIAYTISPWLVELHGHMYFGLSHRAYKVVLEVEKDILKNDGTRVWNNNGIVIHLPKPDNDIIIIFTHFLGHFCFGGIGLRQLCDLCRLLWVYRKEINYKLLENRLRKMRLMSEWKVFAAVAVIFLGMPSEAMPFYSTSLIYRIKANRACKRILKTGNLGHNNDESYRNAAPKWKTPFITFWRRLCEFFSLAIIFPLDAPLFFTNYLKSKIAIERAKKDKR